MQVYGGKGEVFLQGQFKTRRLVSTSSTRASTNRKSLKQKSHSTRSRSHNPREEIAEMKPLDQKPSRALVSILFVLLQACSTLVVVPTTSPSPVPEETSVPLSQLVTVSSISFKEEGQFPAYSITAQTPKFSGSKDERVQTFNQAVSELVQGEIDYFRKNLLAQMPSVPVSAG